MMKRKRIVNERFKFKFVKNQQTHKEENLQKKTCEKKMKSRSIKQNKTKREMDTLKSCDTILDNKNMICGVR